jgi:hypothetical protein
MASEEVQARIQVGRTRELGLGLGGGTMTPSHSTTT